MRTSSGSGALRPAPPWRLRIAAAVLVLTGVFSSICALEAQESEGILASPRISGPGIEKMRPGSFTLGDVVPLTGEPVNGFPNWQERVLHQWINRARVDPQADLAGCPSGNCPENTGGCYVPVDPLVWNGNIGRAARFHSGEMGLQAYFAHDSKCTVVSNINTTYPGSCNGNGSCACVGGISSCNPACTTWSARIGLFGTPGAAEIIAAGYATVTDAFYGWLWENADSPTCSFNSLNGHRWIILKSTSAVGTGYESVAGSTYTRYYTGDFGGSNSPIPKIPSGAHYPQQSASIEFWANWKDAAGPLGAAVNVDGTCYPMTLQRGSSANGAWAALGVTGLGSGCHRYYFSFVDSGGGTVTWPSTGSYGIGTTACADWDASRPASCSAAPAAARWRPLSPCRVIDTRNANGPLGGPVLAAGGTRAFDVTTVPTTCGIPSTATTLTVNYTVDGAQQPGELRVYPGNGTWTGTSVISFKAGVTRANNGHLLLATDGMGTFNVVNASSGTVHVIVDVNGYYE